MLKKFVTFGVACVVLAGSAIGAEAATGPSLFKDGTHKIINGPVVTGNSDDLFDDESENLLVARAGGQRYGNRQTVSPSVRQNVSAPLKLSDLKRPAVAPAARIVSHEGGGERISGKPAIRPARNMVRSKAVQKSSPDPLFSEPVKSNRNKNVVSEGVQKNVVKKQAVYGDSSVFDLDESPKGREPVSFKSPVKYDDSLLDSTNFNSRESISRALPVEKIPKDKADESYKEEISGFSSPFASDSGAIVSDYGAKKISAIPSVREESDYQLLDYTNGIINKIYTKVGYATVVILPPGEKLNRVTLGDRQRFSVQNVFDKSSGSWHIYLKPMQMDIETNIVISTNRHLFNATLATSDYFKPFAKWINVPGAVESVGVDDGALDLAVKDVNQLNFAYSRQGKADFSWSPLNVFDDKNGHTFMNFDASALSKNRPVVFTRGIDGEMKMVPYAVYRNTYVIDNIYDNLEIRSGSKSVRFIRKS